MKYLKNTGQNWLKSTQIHMIHMYFVCFPRLIHMVHMIHMTPAPPMTIGQVIKSKIKIIY